MTFFVVTCFITDLLIVVLSNVNFFIGFHIDSSNDKFQSNQSLDQIMFVSSLQI